jgi:flavin-dependent dehydrogenase
MPLRRKNIIADVVVIGGGPAGSVTAKKCSEKGLTTILLEKKRLPRRKLCSAMLLSKFVHYLIDSEFGPIPERLYDHPKLLGYQWHTTIFGDESLDMPGITNTLRLDLDFWMNKRAQAAGVELWDKTHVKSVCEEPEGIAIKVDASGEEKLLKAKFVVGADGSSSVTRKSIFPELRFRLTGYYSEAHPGALDIDTRYYHIFGSSRTKPTRDWFSVIQKKGFFTIDTNGQGTLPKQAMIRAKLLLTSKYGFNPKSKPLWVDGCTVSSARQELLADRFSPAKGNVVLVGSAAGIATGSERGGGEGINMALKSGILAAEAILKAEDSSKKVALIYLDNLKPVIEVAKTIAKNSVFYQSNWGEREKLLSRLI